MIWSQDDPKTPRRKGETEARQGAAVSEAHSHKSQNEKTCVSQCGELGGIASHRNECRFVSHEVRQHCTGVHPLRPPWAAEDIEVPHAGQVQGQERDGERADNRPGEERHVHQEEDQLRERWLVYRPRMGMHEVLLDHEDEWDACVQKVKDAWATVEEIALRIARPQPSDDADTDSYVMVTAGENLELQRQGQVAVLAEINIPGGRPMRRAVSVNMANNYATMLQQIGIWRRCSMQEIECILRSPSE